MALDLPTSVASLMRLQFEAVNVTINFQCGTFVASGNIQLNVDASL
ncbi:hypothetical protein DFR29_10237 [Tahibacter aquaticus]|uniref:Uncharacterized protein n=1 Tax=Tahibacter aquaticus TaxID=520092 RepID=A0A4R6Z6I7_9GAMM|nr:hypothetical protein [Tahibacter aquaticus]TDR47378.1 hypothetical protein DFR29_10237 [Tahibacter aquaticus]